MAKSNGVSEYELARLERIKENEKMLEELFPEGTDILTPRRSYRGSRKLRVQTDANSQGTGSGSDSISDEEGSLQVKKRSRKIIVYPRRNPSRKARTERNEAERCVTRSVSKTTDECLMDGLQDDQELKKTIYRTIRRRVSTDAEELPIELDDVPACPPTRHVKVVERSSDKIYDRVNGTTCHQCRQKTADTKTVCHNKNCRGVRGQFCSPCLQNRYGEGLLESLRNKEWVCPPCRKICNCSFCLPKRGKPPTGILIHHARDAGCDSVHEYLNKVNYEY